MLLCVNVSRHDVQRTCPHGFNATGGLSGKLNGSLQTQHVTNSAKSSRRSVRLLFVEGDTATVLSSIVDTIIEEEEEEEREEEKEDNEADEWPTSVILDEVLSCENMPVCVPKKIQERKVH